jgi:Tol biopolymer transport system component
MIAKRLSIAASFMLSMMLGIAGIHLVLGQNSHNQLVILSNRTGVFQAYSVDLQTNNLIALTSETHDVSSVSCSSDGEFIATSGEGQSGIKITNVNTLTSSLILQNISSISDVEISPDNQQIAYVFASEDGFEIFLVNLDGTNIRQLTATPRIRETFLSWSPINLLLFSAQVSDSSGIFLLDTQSETVTQLTSNPSIDLSPDWSPDRSQIVFASDQSGRGSIYKMSASGSNLIELTQTNEPNWRPKWSPDNSRIAFTSRRDGNSEIYVMNVDGSNPTRITNDSSVDLMGCWLRSDVLENLTLVERASDSTTSSYPLVDLLSSPNCVSSCWLGISVISPEAEMVDILDTQSIQYQKTPLGSEGSGFIYTINAGNNGYSHALVLPDIRDSVAIITHNGNVSAIDIALTGVSINDVVSVYGTPNAVIDNESASVELAYAEAGLVFFVKKDNPNFAFLGRIVNEETVNRAYINATHIEGNYFPCSDGSQLCAVPTATPIQR